MPVADRGDLPLRVPNGLRRASLGALPAGDALPAPDAGPGAEEVADRVDEGWGDSRKDHGPGLRKVPDPDVPDGFPGYEHLPEVTGTNAPLTCLSHRRDCHRVESDDGACHQIEGMAVLARKDEADITGVPVRWPLPIHPNHRVHDGQGGREGPVKVEEQVGEGLGVRSRVEVVLGLQEPGDVAVHDLHRAGVVGELVGLQFGEHDDPVGVGHRFPHREPLE